MSIDRTQSQSTEDERIARQLSLQRSRPPTDVPGYDTQQFIGSGAYGEVWRGIDRTTGRDVAIKFYTYRGSLDWSLLSREVEKLRFLSADRYVVQLLDVGWHSDPPYYVMEYIEYGSLDNLIRKSGPLPLETALEIFHELVVGLTHAHGKGVFHCDLKPANVLLDQDHKPRLADFGQSRLSDEQLPALGTLFYMAPEQADLEAVPDARWDVYALGAILYYMLTGTPPHCNQQILEQLDSAVDLTTRLENYRSSIRSAPLPIEHRSVPGIDRTLVEIMERCFAVDTAKRFPNVQALLGALRQRTEARRRRPLLVLGIVGPVMLLMLTTLFAWHGYDKALDQYEVRVTENTLEKNEATAITVANNVAHAIDGYFRDVKDIAEDGKFITLVENILNNNELGTILTQLSDPTLDPKKISVLRGQFQQHLQRQPLQLHLEQLIKDEAPKAASWFVTTTQGTHLAAAFDSPISVDPVGKNYAYRTYFHGESEDLIDKTLRPAHITETHLSAAFKSTATNAWKVGISTPVRKNGEIIALVAMTLEMGRLTEFRGRNTKSRFAVLVDASPGINQGVILEHPLYETFLKEKTKGNRLPEVFAEYRVDLNTWGTRNINKFYHDPLDKYEADGILRRKEAWLASRARVELKQPSHSSNALDDRRESHLMVLVLEDKADTIRLIRKLGYDLVRLGLQALGLFLCVVGGLWYFVIQGFRRRRHGWYLEDQTFSAVSTQLSTKRSTERPVEET